MTKLDIICMIQNGFGKLHASLTLVENRLEKIEAILENKNNLITGNQSPAIDSMNFYGLNEKLNKVETAEILKISVKTLDRYRKKGIIPYHQYGDGGKIFFIHKDIVAVKDKIKGNNHGRNYFSELTTP